jgi:membrane-bound lytic murein transglycosylase MltF
MRLIAALAIAGVLGVGSDARAQPAGAKTVAKLPDDGSNLVARPWKGDFDGMVKRRLIRALVVSSRMFYYVDRGTQRGATYEALQLFEKYVNQKYKTGTLPVHVVCIPVRRDQLISGLREGRGDIAAANLGVTAGREETVDFSIPIRSDRDEIVATGPSSKPLASLDDLSGREVYVRKSSSYYEHLEALNARFAKEGRKPATLRPAPETLQDDDLLEMLNAGLVGTVVVDLTVAKFWAPMFPKVVLHTDVVVDKGGKTAWMFREHSPQLKAAVDGFLQKYPEGSLDRNMILQKYLKSTKWVKSATSQEELRKFQQTVALFRQYAARYDIDYLLVMAQAYQESQLNQQAKSRVGAVGIMQLMPATGKDMGVGDIHELEPNIHAGVKYIRFMIDRYYAKEPMDRLNKGLFAFASYNAGPGRVQQLREAAKKRGLDPNVWFDNVELIAAEKIGRETVQYVSNIYKYYVAYTLITEDEEARRKAIGELEKKAS